jgi:HSF-type DNA-binding
MNDQERKSPSALVSALAAATAACAPGDASLSNIHPAASSSDGDALGSGSSAFRNLAGSPTSMRSAALARLAATSSAASGNGTGSLEHLHLLLAQRSQQQQQQDALSEGLHHGFPPHVAALLAQQRLKLLQEQAADNNVSAAALGAGAANAGGAAPSIVAASAGMGHLSTLGLLQQRQSEMLLAEQIRMHHGRLLASQLALHSDALSGPASLGLLNNNEDSHGVTRSNSSASARSSANVGTSGRTNHRAGESSGPNLDGSGSAKGGRGEEGEAGDVADNNDADDNDNKETDDSLDTFPFKLFRMLEEAEAGGNGDIVSFNDKGRCFMIHKPREFVAEIMPKYFTTTRMSSFQVRRP